MGTLTARLERAEKLLTEEAFDEARELADAILAEDPLQRRAYFVAGESRYAQGDLSGALAIYQQSLQHFPQDADLLTYTADLLINGLDDPPQGLHYLETAREAAEDERQEAEIEFLRAVALLAIGQGIEALDALEEMEEIASFLDSPAAYSLQRGIALFELCRFSEAERWLSRVLEDEEESAAAYHYLGLIYERVRDDEEAEEMLAQAVALDPVHYPRPLEVTPDEFEELVEQAHAQLPPLVVDYLKNVAIIVDEVPLLADLVQNHPPLSPLILGMFRGPNIQDFSTFDPWTHFPSSIFLYRRNLARYCRTHEELVREIAITLQHEVGHYLGLSEEELRDRGLE